MSADAAHAHAEHEHRSNWFYTAIAIFLGVVTFVEIGPLFEWYNIPTIPLLILSVVKFFFVVAFFMHLWDDPPIFTRVFAVPLVGGTLMVAVLMTLFSSWTPSPYKDSTALQERYWDRFAGDCYSWLTSAVSNRTYCASGCSMYDIEAGTCAPNVDQARVMLHMGDMGSSGPTFSIAGLSEDEAKKVLVENGKELYEIQCASCHQADGKGQGSTYPPLAGSDYEGYKDPARHAGIIIHGLQGEIVVNGVTYNGNMAGFGQLHDLEIAAIATYERNAWGNDDGVVMPDVVKSAR